MHTLPRRTGFDCWYSRVHPTRWAVFIISRWGRLRSLPGGSRCGPGGTRRWPLRMLVGSGPMENADHPPLVGSDRPDPFVPHHSTTTTEVKCPYDTLSTRYRVLRRWALMVAPPRSGVLVLLAGPFILQAPSPSHRPRARPLVVLSRSRLFCSTFEAFGDSRPRRGTPLALHFWDRVKSAGSRLTKVQLRSNLPIDCELDCIELHPPGSADVAWLVGGGGVSNHGNGWAAISRRGNEA